MCVYGYARVSTKSQILQRQIDNIKAFDPNAIIFAEKFTGTKMDGRVELDRLIKKVKSGDTIIFDEVSRMSRNAKEGKELYEEMFNRGVNLIFLKDRSFDTARYREKLNQHISLSVDTDSNATNGFIEAMSKALTDLLIDLAKEEVENAFKKAESEADRIRQRVKEGIAKSCKKSGIEKGTVLITKKSIEMKKKIKRFSKYFDGDMSDKEFMDNFQISRTAFYKYKKELLEEENE